MPSDQLSIVELGRSSCREPRRSKLVAVPVTLREANQVIAEFHRHNRPVPGARFSIGVVDDEDFWGIAVVGRPIARAVQARSHTIAEVVRCCVKDGSPKGACSFLYAACWRAWRAMGGTRLITYTLQSESGASLRGAGWRVDALLPAGDPAKWQNREGRQHQPVVAQPKIRWEIAL